MVGRFTRRGLLSAVAVLATAPSAAQPDSAVTFVRDFYTREVRRHAAGEGSSEPDFLAVFTADAQRLWRAAQANRNKGNEPAGLILHAFFGRGALPGREIKLGAVTGSGRNAVAVALTIQDNPRTLVVHTAREGGAWKIADINYGSGESFVAYFRKRAGQ
jgi:hypothetical protein